MMCTSHVMASPSIDQHQNKGQIQHKTEDKTKSGAAAADKLSLIIFGPMFSGKTTELMRRIKRYQIANYKCLVIKYIMDNRYAEEGIATHDRQVLSAVSTKELEMMGDLALKYDVIGIDEGQFFPDVVSFSDRMAELGKVIIVAALDGTFQKQGFGDILNLVPLAESVIKLTAVCMNCYSEAAYTKRKGHEREVEVIGGADKYLAVCRQCYASPMKSSENNEKTLILKNPIALKSSSNGNLFAQSQKENIPT